MAPHVLDIGVRRIQGAGGAGPGGGVDYDKLLTITNQHLERAIGQGLLLPRAPGRPLVVVYGGALHNDLFPIRRWPSTRSGATSTPPRAARTARSISTSPRWSTPRRR